MTRRLINYSYNIAFAAGVAYVFAVLVLTGVSFPLVVLLALAALWAAWGAR